MFFEQHPDAVTTIDAGYIRPGIACIHFMLVDGRGAFFDTGTSLSIDNVSRFLRQGAITHDNIDYVIPTHVHLDHAGGAGTMMSLFPNAQLVVHPRGARHIIDPEQLWAGTAGVYGEATAKKIYGEVVPVAESRVLIAEDGFELDFRGRPLRFLDTPGHARHHFCVHDVNHHGIFCGDTMGVSYRQLDGPNGPFIFPATTPVQFDPEALHQSMDRLMETDPRSIYIAHFGRLTPTSQLIDALHAHIDGLIAVTRELTTTNDSGEEFDRMLETHIHHYLFEQAKLHGVPLDDLTLKRSLAMDARLNAQGIAIWWRRQNTTPDS